MGRFTGILGLLTMLALAYRFLDQPARDPAEDGGVGTGAAIRVRGFCACELMLAASPFQKAGDAVTTLLELCLRRIALRIWRSGQARFAVGLFRIWGAADRHLHRRISLPCSTTSASCRSSSAWLPG